MRILYLIHALNRTGGMERVVSLKASWLAGLPGYEVCIATASQKGRPMAFSLNPKVLVKDIGHSEKFIQGPYRRALQAFADSWKPDVVISTGGREIHCLPKLRGSFVKMAEFHFPHDKFYFKHGWNLYSRLRTRRVEKAAAALDSFVVLTRADAEVWRKAVPGVRYIYNPLTFRSPEVADTSCRRAVAVGRLVDGKNFGDLVKAWVQVAEKYPDWILDILGEGPDRKNLEALIAKYGLEGKVNLLGRSSDVRAEMLQSAFLVLSSRFEGFGMVLPEAAECGLPMVAYDCPYGPSEIVRDGTDGILVPYLNVPALSDAILDLIGSPERRAAMGAAARKGAERFRPEAVMAEWTALFEELKGESAVN